MRDFITYYYHNEISITLFVTLVQYVSENRQQTSIQY